MIFIVVNIWSKCEGTYVKKKGRKSIKLEIFSCDVSLQNECYIIFFMIHKDNATIMELLKLLFMRGLVSFNLGCDLLKIWLIYC